MAYGLGSRGVAMMRREFDIPFSKMVWGRGGKDVGRIFLEHALMVADVEISIELACRARGGQVNFIAAQDFSAGSKAFHWTANVNGQRFGLVPDAMFILDFAEANEASRRVVCCLEADRGTMPVQRRSPHLSSINRKFSAYANLWKAESFAKRFQIKRLAVITVTISEERSQNIRNTIAALPEGKGLFSCFPQAAVCPDAESIIDRLTPRATIRN